MTREEIKTMIEQGIPGAEVDVTGDDGQHFEARIVAADFASKSLLDQHKMVYATLGDSMHSAIHALSLRTMTPQQWQAEQESSV